MANIEVTVERDLFFSVSAKRLLQLVSIEDKKFFSFQECTLHKDDNGKYEGHSIDDCDPMQAVWMSTQEVYLDNYWVNIQEDLEEQINEKGEVIDTLRGLILMPIGAFGTLQGLALIPSRVNIKKRPVKFAINTVGRSVWAVPFTALMATMIYLGYDKVFFDDDLKGALFVTEDKLFSIESLISDDSEPEISNLINKQVLGTKYYNLAKKTLVENLIPIQ